MEKVKYIPLLLFSAEAIKCLIMGASYADALVLLILGATASYYEFRTYNNKFDELENKINRLERESEEFKTYMTGIKISSQMRSHNVR